MLLLKNQNTVVRMHNWAGWIDIAGARRGQIDHAIAFTCSNMALPDSLGEAIDPHGNRYVAKGASWPAQSGDGDTDNPADQVPIHGQWARLPSTLDLSPTGPYPRNPLSMAAFPWALTQWAPRHWGAPTRLAAQ